MQSLLNPGSCQRSQSTLKAKTEEINANNLITRLSSLSPQRGRHSLSPAESPVHDAVTETMKRITCMFGDKVRTRTLPKLCRVRKKADREKSLKVLITQCEGMLSPAHKRSSRNILVFK